MLRFCFISTFFYFLNVIQFDLGSPKPRPYVSRRCEFKGINNTHTHTHKKREKYIGLLLHHQLSIVIDRKGFLALHTHTQNNNNASSSKSSNATPKDVSEIKIMLFPIKARKKQKQKKKGEIDKSLTGT